MRELEAETRGRDRIAAASPRDLWQAAETILRYRLTSLAVIRQTDRDARRMFLADLRVRPAFIPGDAASYAADVAFRPTAGQNSAPTRKIRRTKKSAFPKS